MTAPASCPKDGGAIKSRRHPGLPLGGREFFCVSCGLLLDATTLQPDSNVETAAHGQK